MAAFDPEKHGMKNLTQLEGVDWGAARSESYIARACHELRYKPLREMVAEDLRILVNQGIGLSFLMPLVIDLLDKDPLVQGMHYPGDLLCAALRAGDDFYTRYPQYRHELLKAVDAASLMLEMEAASDRPFSKTSQAAIGRALNEFRASHG
jgi:hypothetical protein